MKQKITQFLVAAVAMLLSMQMYAYDFKADGFYYNRTSSSSVSVTFSSSFSYSGTNIIIPKTATFNDTTYLVTSIGSYAFNDCNYPTSIIIPNSVTSIGSYAFYSCGSLISITIPNSVTSIGDYAFDNTPWSSAQPSGLVYAGLVAYKYKGTIPSTVTLKDNTVGIADYLFNGCTNFTSFTFPTGLIEIGKYAFQNCTGLTSLEFPSSLTTIGHYAFSGCKGLTSVTLPTGLIEIGNNAFQNCLGLTSIEFPSSLTSIGNSAFYRCWGLTSVTIPNSVISIGSSAFSGCTDLTSVSIPNSVTSIKDSTFYGCWLLTSLTLPSSVTKIGGSAFSGCSGLTEIISMNPEPPVADVASFNNVNRTTCTLYVPVGSKEKYQATSLWGSFTNIVEKKDNHTMKAHGEGVTEEGHQYGWTISENGIFIECAINTESLANDSWEMASFYLGLDDISDLIGLPIDSIGNDISLFYPIEPDGTKGDSWTSLSPGQWVDINGAASDYSSGVLYWQYQCVENYDGHTQLGEMVFGVNPSKIASIANGTTIVSKAKLCGYDFVVTTKFGKFSNLANNTLYVDSLSAMAGTSINIPINMVNDSTISAFQFDLYLPDGITLHSDVIDNETVYAVKLSDRKASSHLINTAPMSDGSVRIICYSAGNATFKGNTGTLLNLTVDIDENMTKGDYLLQMKNIRLVTNTENEIVTTKKSSPISIYTYITGDANMDFNVSMADVVTTVNYILEKNPAVFNFSAANINNDILITMADVVGIVNIVLNDESAINSRERDNEQRSVMLKMEDISLCAGEAKTVAIDMSNSAGYSAFQMDIVLPNGVSLVDAQLSDRAKSNHSITYSQLASGAVRVISYSSSNSNYSDNSGAIIYFTLKADNDVTAGEYEISINGALVTGNGNEDTVSTTTKLNVNKPTGIGNLLCNGVKLSTANGKLFIEAESHETLRLYSINGSLFKVVEIQPGINEIGDIPVGSYIVNGKKINIK